MRLNFKFLTGDINYLEYGGKFVSKKLNNGDFDYWLVIELINYEQHLSKSEMENQDKYCVQISSVSPDQAGPDHIKSAFDCIVFQSVNAITDIDKVLALSEYGVSAVVWSKTGNNGLELLQEAKKESIVVSGLFGFYMDKPENRLGNDGWNFIKGDIGFKTLEAD